MKNRLIIINPVAGKGMVKKKLFQIVSKLQRENTNVSCYITRDEKFSDVVNYLSNVDEIICCGGDGTLSRLINILKKNNINIPIGYLPFGTTNDFGHNIGMSKNINKNINNIQNGKEHFHDIGKIEDKYFNYVAAFGIFVNTSSNTPQNIKNLLGRMSYIFEGMKELINIPEYDVLLKVDGKEHKGRYVLGIISNSRYVGGFTAPRKGIKLDDGIFEVYLYKKTKPLGMCKRLTDTVFGNGPKRGIDIFTGKNIEIIFNKNVDMTIDGEKFGKKKSVNIEVLNKGIKYIYTDDRESYAE